MGTWWWSVAVAELGAYRFLACGHFGAVLLPEQAERFLVAVLVDQPCNPVRPPTHPALPLKSLSPLPQRAATGRHEQVEDAPFERADPTGEECRESEHQRDEEEYEHRDREPDRRAYDVQQQIQAV
ncbi:hypothetical protein [Streptomyces sp. NPDC002676]